MSARLEYKKDEIVVYLDGEIDHHSASLIRAGIDDAVIASRPSRLVLDFREVTFMDSSAIGLVMGRYKLMKTHQGKIQERQRSSRQTFHQKGHRRTYGGNASA